MNNEFSLQQFQVRSKFFRKFVLPSTFIPEIMKETCNLLFGFATRLYIIISMDKQYDLILYKILICDNTKLILAKIQNSKISFHKYVDVDYVRNNNTKNKLSFNFSRKGDIFVPSYIPELSENIAQILKNCKLFEIIKLLQTLSCEDIAFLILSFL